MFQTKQTRQAKDKGSGRLIKLNVRHFIRKIGTIKSSRMSIRLGLVNILFLFEYFSNKEEFSLAKTIKLCAKIKSSKLYRKVISEEIFLNLKVYPITNPKPNILRNLIKVFRS